MQTSFCSESLHWVFISNFVIGERFGVYALHVFLQLGGAAGTNEHAGDALLMQNPGESHFGKRLVARGGDTVQLLEISKEFWREPVRFEETTLRHARIFGYAVQISVGEQALSKR